MITFLIAGHETTSGLLSFTFYYLLSNPATYARAQQEVDEVVGTGPITVDQLARLPYLNAVLRESLRLSPTVPSIALAAKEDTVLGGKYYIKASTPIVALFAAVHRDPSVYGSDADDFRPERMLDGEFERRNRQFPNSWKPFGNGMRACIGRSFAWQQALLVVAMLLQNLEFSMDDPSYRLRTKQTLTIKPEGFRMRARPRQHVALTMLERALSSTPLCDAPSVPGAAQTLVDSAAGTPMEIYFGSTTGTCEQLARRLASHAAAHGFTASVVDTLQAAKERLSVIHPTVIIVASYNGRPAGNAAQFVEWVDALQGAELANVSYAVYGCGHRDWAKTLHKIPRHLDGVLEARGGTRLAALGTSDVSQERVVSDFTAWEDLVFWPAMRERYGTETGAETVEPEETTLHVSVTAPQSLVARRGFCEARVKEVRTLHSIEPTSKTYMEVSLPPGMTYSASDWLAVSPRNPSASVRRALKHFGIARDSVLTISSAAPTMLPTDIPTSAAEVFRAYVELAEPATRRDIHVLLDATHDRATKAKLTRLQGEAYSEEIVLKQVSVLDLLERFPAVRISLGVFLSMQPPMRVREYSIASSPLESPNRVTFTYSCAYWSSVDGQRHDVGPGSAYLSSLSVGDKVAVSVREEPQTFHLPEDADEAPLIMVTAGTGIIPSASTPDMGSQTTLTLPQVWLRLVTSCKNAWLEPPPAGLLPQPYSFAAASQLTTSSIWRLSSAGISSARSPSALPSHVRQRSRKAVQACKHASVTTRLMSFSSWKSVRDLLSVYLSRKNTVSDRPWSASSRRICRSCMARVWTTQSQRSGSTGHGSHGRAARTSSELDKNGTDTNEDKLTRCSKLLFAMRCKSCVPCLDIQLRSRAVW